METPIKLVADLVSKVQSCTVTKLADGVVSKVSCKLVADMEKIEDLSQSALLTKAASSADMQLLDNFQWFYKDTRTYKSMNEASIRLQSHSDVLKRGLQGNPSDHFKSIYKEMGEAWGIEHVGKFNEGELVDKVLKQANFSDSELKSMGWEVEYPLNNLLEQVKSSSASRNGSLESVAVGSLDMSSTSSVVLAFSLALVVSYAARKAFSYCQSKGQPA
jgi:hypothetical protein